MEPKCLKRSFETFLYSNEYLVENSETSSRASLTFIHNLFKLIIKINKVN